MIGMAPARRDCRSIPFRSGRLTSSTRQLGASAGGPPPELAPVVLNANTPSGTLNFNYLKPYGSIAVNIYKGLSYKAAWNYYGFNEKGPPDPATLSAIGARDFNGNTATFSIRYSF